VDPTAFLAVPAAIDFFQRLGGTALMERNRRLVTEAASLIARRLATEVGAAFEMTGSMVSVRLPIGLAPKRSESDKVRQALRSAGADSPVHALADGLWLRLSAYAYNEKADYERLASLLPGVLDRLRD
jgi:isopenicillin-N epimerase